MPLSVLLASIFIIDRNSLTRYLSQYLLPVYSTCYLFTAPVTGTLQVINSYYKKLSTHYSYFSTHFLWFIRYLSTGFVNIVLLIISILHSYPHFSIV